MEDAETTFALTKALKQRSRVMGTLYYGSDSRSTMSRCAALSMRKENVHYYTETEHSEGCGIHVQSSRDQDEGISGLRLRASDCQMKIDRGTKTLPKRIGQHGFSLNESGNPTGHCLRHPAGSTKGPLHVAVCRITVPKEARILEGANMYKSTQIHAGKTAIWQKLPEHSCNILAECCLCRNSLFGSILTLAEHIEAV